MESIELKVAGMTCGGCVRSVTRVLQGLAGVASAEVSLEQSAAQVSYDPAQVQPQQMRAAIEAAGFSSPA